jgi:HTH-type transcriptional regulator, transcriptional repressor of NAD biosynthesis genes
MEEKGRPAKNYPFMKKGFVLGKFMPLHKGHLALIDFAYRNCDKLYVVVCFTETELIPGILRMQWVGEEIEKYPNATIVSFQYDETELPNTSESSRQVSEMWATALKKIVPGADIFFTSEPYGDYVAGYMNIRHIMFDEKRISYPVSATQIRARPLFYRDFIADSAKPYFVQKVALVGSESTGKTTLAQKLANHYNTVFVPEMAREIIEKTEKCTYDDLVKIAGLHAKTILNKIPEANKLLFVDTDITVTKSYSEFLFNKELAVAPWIEAANRFDLYLFLEQDCEYVQDGTRLSKSERARLSNHHKAAFKKAGLPFISINGNWEERFKQATQIIDQRFFI